MTPDPDARLVACSFEIWRRPEFGGLLGRRIAPPVAAALPGPRTFVGWGLRPSGRRARWLSRGRSPILLEDGILAFAGRDRHRLSCLVDGSGVHYDAAAPSDMERTIAGDLAHAEADRATALIAAWRAARVSKANHLREYDGTLPERYVIVADQVPGDLSVVNGGGDEGAFGRMLRAALDENPGARVVVKAHPAAGGTGYLRGDRLLSDSRMIVMDMPCHPVRLIENCEAVYTVTSQLGLEALFHGKPVRCFGMPLYAGWGLTRDEQARPARRGAATLARLAHACLVAHARYRDPVTGERCTPEDAIDLVARERRAVDRSPRRAAAIGFSAWKRPVLARFLPGTELAFDRQESGLPVYAWGASPAPEGSVRVEDGFLRSAGLGAAKVPPLSWSFDAHGLHFDPSRPSELDRLLSQGGFTPGDLAEARALRDVLVAQGVGKYGASTASWAAPRTDRPIHLVIGQVEDDASLAAQTVGPRTNLELLDAVRVRHPGAFLIYRPHPDVTAGFRRAGDAEPDIAGSADRVEAAPPLGAMLEQVARVHTISSLAGFEALLRGVPVTCHGAPFYAGWGLTEDLVPVPRRRRTLMLDELVAAALIIYPRYVCPRTGLAMTARQAAARIVADGTGPPRARLIRCGLVRTGLRRLRNRPGAELSRTGAR